MSTTDNVKVPFFKKGKSRPTTTRRRSGSPELPAASNISASASSRTNITSEVVLPTRKAATNLLSAGTKRTAAQRTETGGDDDESTREGPDVKWTAAGSHINAALDIIAGDEIEEVLAKRRRKEREDRGEVEEEEAPDGVYKGQKAYRSHLKKDKEIPKAMRIGPQRSANTIRTVTIVDYQPDVCKDYKGKFFCAYYSSDAADHETNACIAYT
jgi:RING finger protein 113A